MLILTAQNLTGETLSDYDVWVGVNHRQIWAGKVNGHVRSSGAAELLRLIADKMNKQESETLKISPIDKEVKGVLTKIRKTPSCPKCGSKKLSCHQNGCIWEI